MSKIIKLPSPLFIGIDCSTSACKAIVWDTAGNIAARGQSPLAVVSPKPAWHEQAAESWWTAMVQCLRQVAAQVDIRRIQALCITNQRETFVPVDNQGEPLCNGILWMDERAQTLLPDLEALFDQQTFHQQTGKHLSVNLTVVKIAWLKENRPDIFAQVYQYLDLQAFLIHRLTGHYRTSRGCADPSGLFDIQRDCWSDEILGKLELRREQFPEVFPPGTILGNLTPTMAEICGLTTGLPVVAGIGDGQACGLGVNITSPGDTYLSMGTSLISGTFSDRYLVSNAFRTMTSATPGSYYLETVILGGTYTLSWFIDKLAAPSGQDYVHVQEEYEQAARELPPGSQGLIIVPYWNSVLAPYWDPSARGIIVGLHGSHGLPHIYRAILEGLAYEQLLNTLGVEETLGKSLSRIIAIGGGSQSDCWCQIIADILGKPVFRSKSTEAAALGAGILAASASGYFRDPQQAAQEMSDILPKPFEPDPIRHEFYIHMYESVYRPLYPAVQPYLDKLTRILGAQETGGL